MFLRNQIYHAIILNTFWGTLVAITFQTIRASTFVTEIMLIRIIVSEISTLLTSFPPYNEIMVYFNVFKSIVYHNVTYIKVYIDLQQLTWCANPILNTIRCKKDVISQMACTFQVVWTSNFTSCSASYYTLLTVNLTRPVGIWFLQPNNIFFHVSFIFVVAYIIVYIKQNNNVASKM